MGQQQSKGIKLDKVDIQAEISTDQATLVAANDASAGETLLVVPDSVWVSAETIRKTKLGQALEGQEPWLAAALLLMAERAGAGEGASGWGPYAAALPASSGSPLTWSAEQQAQLAGTQVEATLQGYSTFFRATWESLQAGLLKQAPGLLPASAASYDNFLWAVATVRARAHAPLGEGASLALVPVADLVQHKRNANAKWAVRGAGLFGKGQVLALEATRAVRRGEPLAMDFGPDVLDSTVLLDRGVVDERQPKEGYSLTLSLSASDRFIDDKLDVLEQEELPQSMTFTLSAAGDGAPPEQMLAFLRLQQLAAGDAFLLESVFRPDVWGFMMEPVSEPNEAAVCRSMASGARAALAAYPTSLDEDEAALAAATSATSASSPGALSVEALAALRVRVGEKRALLTAAGWFEERLVRGLKTLAYYQERRLRRLGLVDDEGRTTYDSFFKDGIA